VTREQITKGATLRIIVPAFELVTRPVEIPTPSSPRKSETSSSLCHHSWPYHPWKVPADDDRSPLVRFGTGIWTYEGGQGQVYKRTYTKMAFTRECLGEFCQYLFKGQTLFRTVGNDSCFYRPPTTNQLLRYLNQIPEDFQMCSKVWEEITIPIYAKHLRYGIRAGQRTRTFSMPRHSSSMCCSRIGT
jgi:hypothetical protein